MLLTPDRHEKKAGIAGETACATTHIQEPAEQGGAGGFACRGIFQQPVMQEFA